MDVPVTVDLHWRSVLFPDHLWDFLHGFLANSYHWKNLLSREFYNWKLPLACIGSTLDWFEEKLRLSCCAKGGILNFSRIFLASWSEWFSSFNWTESLISANFCFPVIFSSKSLLPEILEDFWIYFLGGLWFSPNDCCANPVRWELVTCTLFFRSGSLVCVLKFTSVPSGDWF